MAAERLSDQWPDMQVAGNETEPFLGDEEPKDVLGDPKLLIPDVVALGILTVFMPFAVRMLWKLHAVGVGASPIYAVSLVMSGVLYWVVLLMQIIATATSLWSSHAAILRLTWMLLTSAGLSLQDVAHQKFLKLWLRYAQGVGATCRSPRFRVGALEERLVAALMVGVAANFCAQCVVSTLFYDEAELADEDSEGVPGGRLILRLGQGLDVGLETLWFAVTLRLLVLIPHLGPEALRDSDLEREELEQHNTLRGTAAALVLAHLLIFGLQVCAFVVAGGEDAESIAEGLQLIWYVFQFGTQMHIMEQVYVNHIHSLSYLKEVQRQGRAGRKQRNVASALGIEQLDQNQRAAVWCVLAFVLSMIAAAICIGAVIPLLVFAQEDEDR